MVLSVPGQNRVDASGKIIPSSAVTLQNLKPGVSYVVQVQAVGADNNAVSDWSVGYIFVVPNLT
jgi:hypothetical protein